MCWTFLDLAFLAKTSCADWLPAAGLHCFTALCLCVLHVHPTSAVLSLACSCTKYIISMVFFGSILVMALNVDFAEKDFIV